MLHHSSMNKKRLHLNSANSTNNAAYDRMCVGLGLIENTTTIVCSDSNHSTHNCQAVVFEHRCLQNTSGALVRREHTHTHYWTPLVRHNAVTAQPVMEHVCHAKFSGSLDSPLCVKI